MVESRVTSLGHGGSGNGIGLTPFSCKSDQQLSSARMNSRPKKRKIPEMHNQQMHMNSPSDEEIGKPEVTKGQILRTLDGQAEKGQRMDFSTMRQCAVILKKLMTHQYGWVFNQPVDPVKLQIPDYFSIISKPMDLGTIKSKLECKLYSNTIQFAADVRLTFSNAMRYNPPDNNVHIMAKELNGIFNTRWKSFEHKWRQDIETGQHLSVVNTTQKQKLSSGQVIRIVSSACASRKSQHGTVQGPLNGRDGTKLKIDNGRVHATLLACTNGTSVRDDQCQSGFSQATSTDVKSERPSTRKNHPHLSIAAHLEFRNNSTEAAVMEDNTQNSSHLSSSPVTPRKDEDDSLCLEQLSPTKALRAAMLKSRFADTILKAKQKTLLSHGEKVDLLKMQREREKLEKQQQEEKAKIEARVKAVEDAARMKAEALKAQRQRERQAARLALQKIEKTVEIENGQISKELEALCFCHEMTNKMVFEVVDGVQLRSSCGNPLERLGLFMKEEYLDEDFEDWTSAAGNADIEEGEIS